MHGGSIEYRKGTTIFGNPAYLPGLGQMALVQKSLNGVQHNPLVKG